MVKYAVRVRAADAQTLGAMDQEYAMIVISSYRNEMEAGHDRAFLESNGIHVVVAGMFHRERDPVELSVPREDVIQAAELLRSIGRKIRL